jgi:hypothetical protein
MKLGGFSSTTQRSDSLAQAFMQRFPKDGDKQYPASIAVQIYDVDLPFFAQLAE